MKAQDLSKSKTDIDSILEKIMDTDQILREKFNYALDNFGENSPEFRLATKRINRGDSINQKQIDSIFHKYGWLCPPIVSEKSSKAYFYVIQHAQYEFQRKYKNHVIEAYEKGIINKHENYFFIDRLSIREQKYQKYGTQIMTDNIGNNYFVPIDTIDNSGICFLNKIKEKMKNKDFIVFSNHNFVILFVHSFNPDTNTSIPFLEISLDNKKIGKTNKNGFFQTRLKRKKGESILTITDTNTGKKQTAKLNFCDQIDFFDNYFGFR